MLVYAKNENTLYIKEKWGKEAGIKLSEEAWGEVCSFQWSSTSSMDWREHCWKNIIKYFKTPHQEKILDYEFDVVETMLMEATHFHIFWDYPKLSLYWNGIKHQAWYSRLKYPWTWRLYLGHLLFLKQRRDTKLLQALFGSK